MVVRSCWLMDGSPRLVQNKTLKRDLKLRINSDTDDSSWGDISAPTGEARKLTKSPLLTNSQRWRRVRTWFSTATCNDHKFLLLTGLQLTRKCNGQIPRQAICQLNIKRLRLAQSKQNLRAAWPGKSEFKFFSILDSSKNIEWNINKPDPNEPQNRYITYSKQTARNRKRGKIGLTNQDWIWSWTRVAENKASSFSSFIYLVN